MIGASPNPSVILLPLPYPAYKEADIGALAAIGEIIPL
jgi:hypothetical protein